MDKLATDLTCAGWLHGSSAQSKAADQLIERKLLQGQHASSEGKQWAGTNDGGEKLRLKI